MIVDFLFKVAINQKSKTNNNEGIKALKQALTKSEKLMHHLLVN